MNTTPFPSTPYSLLSDGSTSSLSQPTTTTKTFNDNLVPLSEREHSEAFDCASRLNASCLKQDWIMFGSLLSSTEVERGIQNLQQKYDKEITRQMYLSVFIPRLMKTDRGKYNHLVDFEFKREHVISNLEIAFVFNYVYESKNQKERQYASSEMNRKSV